MLQAVLIRRTCQVFVIRDHSVRLSRKLGLFHTHVFRSNPKRLQQLEKAGVLGGFGSLIVFKVIGEVLRCPALAHSLD
jgi:hypothetical protein